MKQLELYISNQRIDLHEGENIELVISAQKVQDLSKVYGDYSQSFTVPATPTNNKVFKHYYAVDLTNGLDANTRLPAFIQINTFLYRSGVVELEGVQMENGRPKAYMISFYGSNTSLKDKLGEAKLADLDLSAFDHPYSDYNRKTGFEGGYASGTSSSVIYPAISSDDNWFYNSNSSSHGTNNIAYHTTNDVHGIEAHMLKPALRVTKIIDAIEAEYGITFNSTFFGTNKFTDLFMYLNAKEGYIFSEIGTDYTTMVTYTVPANVTNLSLQYDVDYGSLQYQLVFTLNGEVVGTKTIATNLNGAIFFFDSATEGDVIKINLRGVNGRFTEIDGFDWEWYDTLTTSLGAQQSIGTRSHTPQITIADLMPDLKVSEFLSGLISMFNLVIHPTDKDVYDIEPLDDWFANGNTHDLTEYIDISKHTMTKLPLHNRIEMKYQEPEAIINSQYVLNNQIGYGDLRADFDFDGDELVIELPFENLLFESLTDQANDTLTNVLVGKCFDREFSPVANKPMLFYRSGNIDITDNPINFINSYLSNSRVNTIHHCQAVHTSGFSLNFGAEVDPLALDIEQNGLYKTYYEDYITDLYDSSRRLWKFEAVLPLSKIILLEANDLITVYNRNFKINQLKINLTTGKTSLELINDV